MAVRVSNLEFPVAVALFLSGILTNTSSRTVSYSARTPSTRKYAAHESGRPEPRKIRFPVIGQAQQHDLRAVTLQAREDVGLSSRHVPCDPKAQVLDVPAACSRNVRCEKRRNGGSHADPLRRCSPAIGHADTSLKRAAPAAGGSAPGEEPKAMNASAARTSGGPGYAGSSTPAIPAWIPVASHRAAASALSSGRVLKAMGVPGAAL